MNRAENYSVELTAYAEEVRNKPFKWGETDCGSLVKAALRIIYGLEVEIKSYRNVRGATTVYKGIGSSLSYLIDLGFKPVAPAYAGNGDLVVVKENPFDRCGVIVANQILTSEIGGTVSLYPLDRKNLNGVVLR